MRRPRRTRDGSQEGCKGERGDEQSLLVLATLPHVVGTVVGCAIRERGGEGASEHERVMRAAGTPRSRSQRAHSLPAASSSGRSSSKRGGRRGSARRRGEHSQAERERWVLEQRALVS